MAGKEAAALPELLYGPPPATLTLLLDDPAEHDVVSLERLLAGLTPQQALQVPPGLPFSIARILAHLHANVVFNLTLIQSREPLAVQPPTETWPTVAAGEWPALAQAFLDAMAQLRRVAQDGRDLDRTLYPATATQPGWTVGYKLALSVAKHNTYHLGQIALIRRLVGSWD